MLCPFCKEKDTSVVDSRPTEDGTAIRRRRLCGCERKERFTTFERVQFQELTVIKGSGKRAPFDRDKISKSIRISLRKRPIDSDSTEKFISKIVRNLEGLGESEIPTATIGKFIMEGLSNLDQVAYVRFASVYKNFKEALDPSFKKYTKQVIDNAKILSETLVKNHFKIFSGGTDTHLMLLDLRDFNLTGKLAELSLGKANITCNKNSIPFDTQSPMITSGVRLGTPASTTRGFGQREFVLVGQLISKLLKELSKNPENNSKAESEVKKEVIDLCGSFPIYSSQ